MVRCGRCGTGFGVATAILESCPRCMAKEGVAAPLTWQLREGGRGAETRALRFAQEYLSRTGGIDSERAAVARGRQV
jgi:hypothetical protein